MKPPYLKLLPEISEANRPFWGALERHKFLFPRCSSCGDYNWPPYPACRSCLSEGLERTEASGDAEVFSYTIVHRGYGRFNDEVPYVIDGQARRETTPVHRRREHPWNS